MYSKKLIALATKHHKERVIAPHFKHILKAKVNVALVNTDLLGTFTEEVSRQGSGLETAERKALLGMAATKLMHGLASEGSFGPHPLIPFLACHTEILMFIDQEHNFKIHETLFTEKTNYQQICVNNFDAAESFIEKAKFPSHALIVRPNPWDDNQTIFKGIQNKIELETAFRICKQLSSAKNVSLETDMRAHVNPMRMQIIDILAQRLAKRINTLCPNCKHPGWGKVRDEEGLICDSCSNRTKMIAFHVYGCISCDYEEQIPRSDNLQAAPPVYCEICNP